MNYCFKVFAIITECKNIKKRTEFCMVLLILSVSLEVTKKKGIQFLEFDILLQIKKGLDQCDKKSNAFIKNINSINPVFSS